MQKTFRGVAKDFVNAMRLNFIGKGADPNSIIVQDLYDYQPSSNNLASYRGISNNKNQIDIFSMSPQDRKLFENLLAVYNTHISTKRELLIQARKLFDTDVVQTVIDVMIDDGFNSFINEEEEFRITYELSEDEKEVLGESFQEEVQSHIDDFVETFSIKTLVPELLPELLRDGEYALGVLFEEGKGITEIVDDMDVINLLPFYLNDKLTFVMKQNNYSSYHSSDYQGGSGVFLNNDFVNPPVFYKPENVVFFRLKYFSKQRINMSDFYNTEFRNNFYEHTGIRLPKFVRICKPIYSSAIKNLNRLQIMEDINTVLDLYQILKPDIVNVSVPQNTSAPEAAQIIRDYERQLNDVSAFTDSDSLDLPTLATMANRRKVLPQWLDGKGTVSRSDINTSEKTGDSRDSIQFLRNLIAVSIGIPPFYINILDNNPLDKAQTIKLYSRYTKKLTSLQKSLADGIKDLLMIHLKYLGLNISRSNLSVKFKAITSGDSLDDTDMMVATVTGINELYKGVSEISQDENNDLVLDSAQFKELFDNLTSRYLNISDLLIIDENKFTDVAGAEPQDGDFELSGTSGGSSDFEIGSTDLGVNDVEATADTGTDTSYQDFVADTTAPEIEEPEQITTEEFHDE